ncbi:LysR family transcriptional regulator [Burkholderiaceae bacterium FT117]|uniref:LysR family transcriptional regulator n=1 Tax=Zeimonas sediminis TaxID=2944268 RepID=UPI002343090B|nr:LysR family transcriptional regulator [Zeimonas sediminis]MCM5570211.1 LysR family transcriptional regulator [Zeimonas sediminis]
MRRKLPSTQALVCFEAAARHESFTKAAHELALTQSAVYRQVAGLEDFLGVKLFRRSRHGIVLTEAGLNYSRRVARRLDAVERDALAVIGRGEASGTIDLAVVPTFASRWLLPRLQDFRVRHPDIVVNMETSTRPFLFADTDFDAAIYAGTPADLANWPGTVAVALMAEIVVPVCAPALIAPRRRLTPAQVAGLPLLQQSTRPYAWRQWFEAQGVEGARDLDGPRFDLFSMLAVAAARGMGAALMPAMLIEGELARGELIVPCDRPLHGGRSYHLVMPERKAGNPALARFRDWLVDAAGAG